MTADDLVRWLLSDAPSLEFEAFLRELARRLVAAGVPVDRLWTGRLFLNPLVAGDAWCWTSDGALVHATLPYAELSRAQPAAGPMRDIFLGRVVHQALAGLPRGQHGLSESLWDDGYVDLAAFGVQWTMRGATNAELTRVAVSLATKAPGGFDARAIETLDRILDAIRIVMRVIEDERLTRSLLGTYLGANAAERVLAGQIRRGDGATVPAALWFSDLRGFTTMSDTLPLPSLLGLLDDAFEAQARAIHAHGGEVLKFIGDGLLAVFRGDAATACPAALAAARAFAQELAGPNARRAERGDPPVRYGLALHYGDVMYGNIGAPDRLDFTVIGPAVNLAARLEGLSSKLGREVVLSAPFAAACGADVVPLGEHTVKGLGDTVPVYALSEA